MDKDAILYISQIVKAFKSSIRLAKIFATLIYRCMYFSAYISLNNYSITFIRRANTKLAVLDHVPSSHAVILPVKVYPLLTIYP